MEDCRAGVGRIVGPDVQTRALGRQPRRTERGQLSAGPVAPDLAWPDLLLALTGKDVALCPRCQQRTIQRQALPPTRAPPENRSAA